MMTKRLEAGFPPVAQAFNSPLCARRDERMKDPRANAPGTRVFAYLSPSARMMIWPMRLCSMTPRTSPDPGPPA